MKKNYKIITILLMFSLSCSDMETIVDLEIPPHESMLVLNGRLDTDKEIKVLLSNSVGAFDNNRPAMVNDANITLFEDQVNLGNLEIDLNNYIAPYVNDGNWQTWDTLVMNYYKINYVPKKDKTYRLEVQHPNYNSISASTYIPDDIELYNIEIDSSDNGERINFEFSFDDDVNIENFYSLSIDVSCTKVWDDYWGYEDFYTYDGFVEMNSNDPSFPINNIFDGYTYTGERVIFNDALFNGQQKNISIDIFTDDFKYDDCDTIKFEFATFSDDSYRYYNSLAEQRNNGGVDIFGGEVVPVYTNIENGLGIIISKNAQEIFVKPN